MYDTQAKSSANGFPARLRLARDQAELTQKALAEQVGVSLRAIQTWEYGTRHPRGRSLNKLARVLDRPVSWFYETEEVAA